MEWISVLQQLPPKREKVIIITHSKFGGNIHMAFFIPNYIDEVADFGDVFKSQDKSIYPMYTISHWMPLPELPKS